ncbi:hypothetical protein D1B31_22270 [Neobacillus notoginsengisoli]|uniref:Abortive phage infection protein n=1 Tax=Neobacillus notoginsengisoli TaxID=1578198 RepID=A0A417YFA2_9BACI|nr:hypothetical protein [Neobacillus notoginsengisoli]RHW31409.1 hypothetical protein D1B31_22270 [Neobacillus notoginsengisoli]
MIDQNGIYEILEQLKNGELAEYYVTKEDFLPFREVLVKRHDFKHFRGIAQRGGGVIYEYEKEPRS